MIETTALSNDLNNLYKGMGTDGKMPEKEEVTEQGALAFLCFFSAQLTSNDIHSPSATYCHIHGNLCEDFQYCTPYLDSLCIINEGHYP